jgi:hypothetical protein
MLMLDGYRPVPGIRKFGNRFGTFRGYTERRERLLIALAEVQYGLEDRVEDIRVKRRA